MKISVLIPVFNQREALLRTLRGLIPENNGLEVLVVDLHSTDGSREAAATHDWVRVLTASSPLVATALNEAAAVATGELLFFLQPGSLPARGWTRALTNAFDKGADAVHLVPREEDPAFPWAASVRSFLRRLGYRGLGGATSLSGGAVRRKLFLDVDGFRPLADFEWMGLQQRLRQAGARILSLSHEVVLTPRPGAQHADACHELLDELCAAWKFRQADALDPVRRRRRSTALILFGYDALGQTSSGSAYFQYARREQFRISLEQAQSYPYAQRVFLIAGPETAELAGQPSGVELVGGTGDTAIRFAALRERLTNEGVEALLLVRAISTALTHAALRRFAETPRENPCAILPAADTGEWLALSVDAKAFPHFATWTVDASIDSFQTHLRQQVVRCDVERALPVLKAENDARAMYYAGMLEQAPA